MNRRKMSFLKKAHISHDAHYIKIFLLSQYIIQHFFIVFSFFHFCTKNFRNRLDKLSFI